jgi:uncharacterized protein YdhG (YjbR/CyaY superfamily)
MITKAFTTIDEYIATFPKEVQVILEKIRQTIKTAAPLATEAISYQMPTFKQNGNLIHFAAYKKHIGLYPTPSGVEEFKAEMSEYVTTKGGIQFPIDKPIPYDLIKRMTEFRVKVNSQLKK